MARASMRRLLWVGGIAVVLGVAWLARSSWPMQTLFILIGVSTGTNIQNLWDPPVRWHVKQTLTIETPQGEVTGSVVRAKAIWKDRLHGTSPQSETGEALAIEVSPGRYLFAVLDRGRPDELALMGFPKDQRIWDSMPMLDSFRNKPLAVPPEHYPLMVTFGDIEDPTTVAKVDPLDLPATFGPGYSIKSYDVLLTDEPVTTGGIAGLLPWLGPYPEPPLCQPRSDRDASFCAADIHHGNFIGR